MSAANAAPAVKMGQIAFRGRVVSVRKQGQFFYTLCKLPAADEYSSPNTVEIQSKNRFAETGADFNAVCKVAGYPRSYEINKDGDKVTVHTADHRFHLIED